MTSRSVYIGGGLVLVVGALAYRGTRDAFISESSSTKPLVADMNELTAEEPPNSFAVFVTECTGEGSFPAHVNVTLESATFDTYRARASGLGWTEVSDSPDGYLRYERSDRVLIVDGRDSPAVELSVQGADNC